MGQPTDGDQNQPGPDGSPERGAASAASPAPQPEAQAPAGRPAGTPPASLPRRTPAAPPSLAAGRSAASPAGERSAASPTGERSAASPAGEPSAASAPSAPAPAALSVPAAPSAPAAVTAAVPAVGAPAAAASDTTSPERPETDASPAPASEEPEPSAPEPQQPEPGSTPEASAPEPQRPQPAPTAAPEPTSESEEDSTPYQPRVRSYEQRRLGVVAAPTATSPATGAPTEAIPAVGAAARAASSSTPGPTAGGGGTADVPPPAGSSPLDGLSGDGAPSRWPKVLIGAGLGVVVLAGLYVGAQWLVADDVAKDTTVAGVDIGGLPADEAVAALEQGLGPRAAEPITVQAGEATSTLDPAESGLALDAQGTVDAVTGFTLSPGRLLDHVVGGDAVAPVLDVDRGALSAAVEQAGTSLATEPVDGTVRFTDGEPVATDPEDGTEVVVDAADDAVVDAWLVTTGPVELPTEAVTPAIDQADTDAALAEAEQVVSGPVTVEVGDQSPELPERVLARSTSFVPTDGALVAQYDGDRLTSAVVDRTDDLLTEPESAHFEFSGGEPVIVGGATGTTLDPEQVAESVGAAATSSERTAQVELVEQDPEDSRASLEELGVKEVISEFSTPLTSEPIRTKNLVRGAQLVNGTLIKPDETFSLVDTLSPIEVSNGYFAAGVVNNGIHSDAVGGGLSQMATTTYNAGFFAGFDDVEHRQHSYWFSRYPAGREATIYVGSIDMKFTNDTPYGALMQSYVSGGRLHVKIWSTEYYDVEESTSGKQEIVPATTVDMSGSAGCEPYPGGQDGFAITVYRKVYLEGELVKDESDFWRYKPDNAVSCTAPRSEDDEADRKDRDGKPARDEKED